MLAETVARIPLRRAPMILITLLDDKTVGIEGQFPAGNCGPTLELRCRAIGVQGIDNQALHRILRDRKPVALEVDDESVSGRLALQHVLAQQAAGGIESLDPFDAAVFAVADHHARPAVVIAAQRVRGAKGTDAVLAAHFHHPRVRHQVITLRGHGVAAGEMPVGVGVDRSEALGHAPTPHDLPVIRRHRPHHAPIGKTGPAHQQRQHRRDRGVSKLAAMLALMIALAQIVEFDAEDDGDQPQQRQAFQLGLGVILARANVGRKRFLVLLDDARGAVRPGDPPVAHQHCVGERVAGLAFGQERQHLVAAAELVEHLDFALDPFRSWRERRADHDQKSRGLQRLENLVIEVGGRRDLILVAEYLAQSWRQATILQRLRDAIAL